MNQTWTRHLPARIREKIDRSPALKKAVGNSGWLFADNLLRMGVGLLVSIWVTRYLGPERYGALSYATAFVMIFSSIAMVGLEGIVVRNIVREPGRRNEILGSAFVLKLIGGGVAFALTLAAIALLRPVEDSARLLVGIIALGTLFQAFGTADFWFQSQVKSRYSAYARSAACIIICAVKVVLIIANAPLVAFAWAAAAEIALGFAGVAAAYRLSGQHMRDWRANRTMAAELLRDSWPLLLSDLVMFLYLRVDKIMIGEMVGNRELGIFAVAAMIAEALYIIPLAIYPSLFPSIVAAKGESEELFDQRMQQFYNLMALLAYLVALPVTFLSVWLVPLIFGEAYGNAGTMLAVLVWAGLFFNLMVARSQFLTAMNWTRLHFITDLLGCVLNVALNFFLIPRYGGMGAVVASVISYWFVAHGSCFVFKPLFKTGTMMTRAMLYPKIW